MWKHRAEELKDHPSGAAAVLVRPSIAGQQILRGDFIEGLAKDASFRAAVHAEIRGIPYPAFLWETPPVTRANLDRPFEFVAIESTFLARQAADPTAFREHYSTDRSVVTFESLRRDALLIAPCPANAAYPHLAAFVSDAPPETVDALWRSVGEAMAMRLGDAPIWLSTSGLGIPWLHVRLDSRPKYYAHPPFRRPV